MGRYKTKLYFFAEVGWRSLATIKKKVLLLNDLKGLRMRSQENPFHLAMWKSLRTKPFPISITETGRALQTNIVDGLDNTPVFFLTTSWYLNIKYLTKTEHIYQPGMAVLNTDFFNSMPKYLQKQFMKDNIKYAAKLTKLVRNLEQDVFNNFKETGIEILTMSEKEKEKMRQATKSVHKMFLDSTSIDGKKLYNKVNKLLKGDKS